MAIEIRFDASQQFQLDAIDSVVSLFAGQESAPQGLRSDAFAAEGVFAEFQEVVFGNTLSVIPETIETNLRRIQDREIVRSDGSTVPAIPTKLQQKFATDGSGLDFSVEMETGTGKTYVYLRTIAELHRKYGFSKFVIVVPSIAIREGVLSGMGLLKEHIRDLYDGLQYDSYVWDSRFPTRVHQYATASHLQIMVINIDSFTSDANIFQRAESDRLNGFAPAEWVKACRPVVIMDEPQNMETPTRREAIASLAPLFRLRYSATHRDPKHLVYRLTPVDAYDLRLVKRIGVLSVTKDDDLNEPYVEVTKINATPKGVTATAKIFKATKVGTKLTQVPLRKDDDLHALSGGRTVYDGWAVEDIHAAHDGIPGYVEFGNGIRVREGRGTNNDLEQHQRLMLRQAVRSHFEKEMALKRGAGGAIPSRLKPLTLFFIDRVANYHPADGKFRQWFEQEYEAAKTDALFRMVANDMPDVSVVHDGYFATSARGEPKDTTFGKDTKDTESAFTRIMQRKGELLGFDEPLRFIFSHSALVEGWDNPNVFTICNLQDGKSLMRKRQQIGRGLRLPVMENGERCRVDEINVLTVIANESFAKFAGDLQTEIEEETGVSFEGRIIDKRHPTSIRLKEEVLTDPIFQELWKRISGRTTYRVSFDSEAVVKGAVERIAAMDKLEPIKFRVSMGVVGIDHKGVSSSAQFDKGSVVVEGARRLPDVVGELSRRVPLSRATIVKILTDGKVDLDQVKVNPSVFIDQVATAMNDALYAEAAKRIVYSPIKNGRWPVQEFKDAHQAETFAPAAWVVDVSKSVTDKIVCDSNVEVAFANYLESREDVPLFLKLPHWYKIDTPLGGYNPDWAVVRSTDKGKYVYFVRETKGTDDLEKLQWKSEGWKIRFGDAHFTAIGVDFAFNNDPDILIQYPTTHLTAT